MKIDWLIQKDGNNTIGDNIIEAFDRNPKKVYAMISDLKDSGLEILEEGFIDTKAEFNLIVAYNRKNTTRIMLESILRNSKKLYVYDNNEEVRIDGNMFIFVYKEVSVVYTYTGDTTENSLKLNKSFYTKVIYDLSNANDKEEFKEMKKVFDDMIKDFNLEELTRDMLSKLQADKKIFTPKIYNHNVKSVAELLAESKAAIKQEDKKEEIYEEDSIKTVDLTMDDFNIAIDFKEDEVKEPDNILDRGEDMDNIEIPDEEYVGEIIEDGQEVLDFSEEENDFDEEPEEIDENQEVLDLESMIFGKKSMKIKNDSEPVNEEEIFEEDENIKTLSKKIDLNSATTLIMQLPKPATRGKEVNTIKVPNYIKSMLPSFIEFSKDVVTHKEDGVEYKSKNIKFSILDVNENKMYEDSNARILYRAGQTYLAFSSDEIKNINIEENYIARIMKISSDEYRCEIIPLDSNEYSVWKKVCNLTFRGSERKYGVM